MSIFRKNRDWYFNNEKYVKWFLIKVWKQTKYNGEFATQRNPGKRRQSWVIRYCLRHNLVKIIKSDSIYVTLRLTKLGERCIKGMEIKNGY